MKNRTPEQAATIFRALGSPYRLRTLQLLRRRQMTVGELAEALGISFKNTSRNLGILLRLDLVESEGRHGHVHYRLNRRLPAELKTILRQAIF